SSYVVKRSLASSGFTTTQNNATSPFIDTNVVVGTKYYYVVEGVTNGQYSADSAVVNAVPKTSVNLVVPIELTDLP
ncbi:hypothetical protein ACSTI0_00185, partial [Vibrio parahaemolyticus]